VRGAASGANTRDAAFLESGDRAAARLQSESIIRHPRRSRSVTVLDQRVLRNNVRNRARGRIAGADLACLALSALPAGIAQHAAGSPCPILPPSPPRHSSPTARSRTGRDLLRPGEIFIRGIFQCCRSISTNPDTAHVRALAMVMVRGGLCRQRPEFLAVLQPRGIVRA